MKKFFIALALICTVFTVSFASDVKVSGKVLKAFKINFSKAENITWAQVENLYQAQFILDGDQYSAYFDSDGNLKVTARFLTINQLPHGLKTSLREKAEDSQVAFIFELNDDEGLHYYASVQKEDKKQMLRSFGTKKWSLYHKVKM